MSMTRYWNINKRWARNEKGATFIIEVYKRINSTAAKVEGASLSPARIMFAWGNTNIQRSTNARILILISTKKLKCFMITRQKSDISWQCHFNCWMNEGNLKFRFVRAVIWIVGYVEETPCSTNQMTRLTNMNFVAAYHSSIRYSPTVFIPSPS